MSHPRDPLDDESLVAFLRDNAPKAPEAPRGLEERILGAISATSPSTRRSGFRPRIRVAIFATGAAAAAALIVAVWISADAMNRKNEANRAELAPGASVAEGLPDQETEEGSRPAQTEQEDLALYVEATWDGAFTGDMEDLFAAYEQN